MEARHDEQAAAGADLGSEMDASSDGSCLDDIETELYSRIYYTNGSASNLGSAAAASTPLASHHIAQTIGSSGSGSDSSSAVSNGVGATRQFPTTGCDATVDPCPSGGERAACSQPDHVVKVSEQGSHDDADLADDAAEYVILSSDDDGSGLAASRSASYADSCILVDSEDSDVYSVNEDCDFEFNTLSQVPKYPASIGSLEDVLASLPAHGWHIIAADKYPSSSRSRYYNVQCRNCNDKGHVANECRKPKKVQACILCGTKGHISWSCKQQLCVNCGQFGHSYSSCRSPHRKLLFCQRCHRRGHVEETCAELWRQFHWAIGPEAFRKVTCRPPSKARVNKLRYCANCALRGHFTHECKAAWSNPFRPVLSVFVNEYKNPKRSSTPTLKAASKAHLDARISRSAVKSKQCFVSADRGHGAGGSWSHTSGSGQRAGCSPAPANRSTNGPPSSGGQKQKQRPQLELWEAKRARKARKRSERSAVAAEQLPSGHAAGGQETPRSRRTGNGTATADELLAASTPIMSPWEQRQSHGGSGMRSSELDSSQPSGGRRGGMANATTGNGSVSRGAATWVGNQQQQQQSPRMKNGSPARQQKQQKLKKQQKQQHKQGAAARRRSASDATGDAGGTPAKRRRSAVPCGSGELVAAAGTTGGKRPAHVLARAAAAPEAAEGQGHGGMGKAAGRSSAKSPHRRLLQQQQQRADSATVQRRQRQRGGQAQPRVGSLVVPGRGEQRSSKAVGQKRGQQASEVEAGWSSGGTTPRRVSKMKKRARQCVTVTDGDITSHHFRSADTLVVRFSY